MIFSMPISLAKNFPENVGVKKSENFSIILSSILFNLMHKTLCYYQQFESYEFFNTYTYKLKSKRRKLLDLIYSQVTSKQMEWKNRKKNFNTLSTILFKSLHKTFKNSQYFRSFEFFSMRRNTLQGKRRKVLDRIISKIIPKLLE